MVQRTWTFCLTAIVFVALAVRGATLAFRPDAAIDMDGTEYVRAAENMLSGHGAIGMRGLPMVVFPPLYSWTIALLVRIGFAPEHAAQAISIAGGCAFVLAIALLVARLYDRRTALAAALIAAVLPICIETSTTAVTEAPFAAFATIGLWSLVEVVRSWSGRAAALSGVAFGAAYLLRPEGAFFALAALLVVLAVAIGTRRSIVPVVALGACAFALALPLIVTTDLLVGHVVLEGKSAINFQLAEGLRRGASYLEVADAVDASGRAVGPEINLSYYDPDGHPPQFDVRRRVVLAALAARQHVRDIPALLADGAFGSGMLLLLAVLGLFGAAWSRSRLRDEVVVIVYLCAAFVALAGVWHMWPRYGMLVLPVLLVWSSAGIVHLRRWSSGSRFPDVGIAALGLLVVICLARDVAYARSVDVPIERATGAFIAAHPAPGLVVDVSTRTAFYAGTTWSPLPYGDESASTRYLRAIAPSYVVLDSSRATQYPLLQRWFEHGLPPSLATRAFVIDDGHGRELAVYRFGPHPAGTLSGLQRTP